MLQVTTLGELGQTAPGGGARPLRRKPLALVAYLARRLPRPVPRTELATLFWGERGEERARQSLRQALLEVKQSLGEAVDVDAEMVRLAPGAVELDILAFERDLSAGRLTDAVARWTGDFFEGAEDIGGDGFRRWIENERVALHRQLGVAMQKLIGDAELRGDWPGAAQWAARWTAALPFDEQAHLRLIEALRMDGRSGEALSVHGAFVSRIRTALDVEPSAEFLRLGGGLADGARTEIGRRSRGSAAVHAPALVGRGTMLGELGELWHRLGHGPGAVALIRGASGSGKSRLAEDFAERVRPDGLVLAARGAPGDGLATAAALFAGLGAAAGIAGAAPDALAHAARLVPALRERFRHLPTPPPDDAALRDGLAHTLAAVAEEQPVLLLVDEFPAADAPSRALIAGLASRLSGRLFLLLTADDGDPLTAPALELLGGVRGMRRLQLEPLELSGVETMLDSMVSMEPTDRHALAQRVAEDSAGLPQSVHDLVDALVNDHLLAPDASGIWRISAALSGRPLPLPQAARERTRAALDALSPAARTLAEALAVVGEDADASVAAAVAELSPDAGVSAWHELRDRRLVREGATFASPLLARAVAAVIPPTRRQALHARTAEVLTTRDLASTAERSLLPYHLARAEPAPPAIAPAPAARRSPLWIVAAGVGAAALLIGVGLFLRPGRPAIPADGEARVPIVALGRIVDYRENAASDLTRPLTDMLATNLGRIPRLRVVSSARMYELVAQAHDTTAGALVAAARRAGATELVDGALYAREDGGFRLDLRRVELASGSLRQTYSVVGTTVFDLADSGTAHLASDFGEQRPIGSIADVTTRSLAAYRLYEQGLRAFHAGDIRGSEPSFAAALAEDSSFAMAAYYLAQATTSSPRLTLARFAQAARLAARTSDRERLIIQARLAFHSSDPNLGAVAETLAVRYPDEVEGHFFSGLAILQLGDFQRALPHFNRVIAMDSLALTGARASCMACEAFRQVVSLYQLSDSLPAAERTTRRWIRLQPGAAASWHYLAEVLSQMGRPAEAMAAYEREATLDAGRREGERLLIVTVHKLYAGEYEEADRLLDGEIQSGSPYREASGYWYRSLSRRAQGRLREALDDIRKHRALTVGNYPKGSLAPLGAAPTEGMAEGAVLFEMGRFKAAAALWDSVSRLRVGDESPSQLAHARAWAMTHATGAMIAGGDTQTVSARADTIEALGKRSGNGRDRVLHHYVRGLLLAARGLDEAAVAEFRAGMWSWNFGYTRTNMAMARSLLRLRRPVEAVAVLQAALRGTLEASNFYVPRPEIHERLGQAWLAVGSAAARDSAEAHFRFVERAWSRADSSFAQRLRMLRQPDAGAGPAARTSEPGRPG